MTAFIEFLGTQKKITGESSLEIPITEFPVVGDALEHVSSLFPTLFMNRYNTMITVNDEISPADRALRAGDKIVFLPVVGGG